MSNRGCGYRSSVYTGNGPTCLCRSRSFYPRRMSFRNVCVWMARGVSAIRLHSVWGFSPGDRHCARLARADPPRCVKTGVKHGDLWSRWISCWKQRTERFCTHARPHTLDRQYFTYYMMGVGKTAPPETGPRHANCEMIVGILGEHFRAWLSSVAHSKDPNHEIPRVSGFPAIASILITSHCM